MKFDLEFQSNSPDCQGKDNILEGLELSFRRSMEGSPGEWIPLMYFTKLSNATQSFETLMNASDGNFILRGYKVPYFIENESKSFYNVSICGDEFLQYPLQFRWLRTSYQEGDDSMCDGVMLDNVVVSVSNDTHSAVLFEDCFDDENSIE